MYFSANTEKTNLKIYLGDSSINQLELHVIFIHIRSDQQLSRIFPSLQKNSNSTQDHIAPLKFKTADTPFQFQGENLVIDNHSYVLHTHFTSLSNINLKT